MSCTASALARALESSTARMKLRWLSWWHRSVSAWHHVSQTLAIRSSSFDTANATSRPLQWSSTSATVFMLRIEETSSKHGSSYCKRHGSDRWLPGCLLRRRKNLRLSRQTRCNHRTAWSNLSVIQSESEKPSSSWLMAAGSLPTSTPGTTPTSLRGSFLQTQWSTWIHLTFSQRCFWSDASFCLPTLARTWSWSCRAKASSKTHSQRLTLGPLCERCLCLPSPSVGILLASLTRFWAYTTFYNQTLQTTSRKCMTLQVRSY